MNAIQENIERYLKNLGNFPRFYRMGSDIKLEIIHEEILSLLMVFHVTIPTRYCGIVVMVLEFIECIYIEV